MFVPTIPASLTALPAAAFVAAGVLGALGARLRRHSPYPTLRARVRSPDAIPSPDAGAAYSLNADFAGAAEGDSEPGESAAVAAAVRLLDGWCERPRSAWRTLGASALQAKRTEACARTASQVILEGVLARHAPLMDAWLVRDFADTAWFSAPEDEERSSSAIEMAARRAVTNGALALLAREWLPGEDFERLTMMVVMH